MPRWLRNLLNADRHAWSNWHGWACNEDGTDSRQRTCMDARCKEVQTRNRKCKHRENA